MAVIHVVQRKSMHVSSATTPFPSLNPFVKNPFCTVSPFKGLKITAHTHTHPHTPTDTHTHPHTHSHTYTRTHTHASPSPPSLAIVAVVFVVVELNTPTHSHTHTTPSFWAAPGLLKIPGYFQRAPPVSPPTTGRASAGARVRARVQA